MRRWPFAVAATLAAAAALCAGAGRASVDMLTAVPPADITATADTGCNGSWCAQVSYTFTATGGYPPYYFICNLPSGGLFLVGTTRVSCYARDSRGDTSREASFTITVNAPDGDPPPPPAPPPPPPLTLTVPGNILTTATTPCASSMCAEVDVDVSASGGYPPYTFICGHLTGELTVGTIPDSCIAQDAKGNSTPPKAFSITVLPPPDEPFTLTPPGDTTVAATTPCTFTHCAEVSYDYDVSGGYAPYTLSCNIPSGTTLPVGTYTVTCSAVDAGNETAGPASFSLTVAPADAQRPPGLRHGNRFHPHIRGA